MAKSTAVTTEKRVRRSRAKQPNPQNPDVSTLLMSDEEIAKLGAANPTSEPPDNPTSTEPTAEVMPAPPAAPATTAKPTLVRHKVVHAGACPRSERHTRTRVYKTAGTTRFCVCDDCGETWKRVGPLATTVETAEAAA